MKGSNAGWVARSGIHWNMRCPRLVSWGPMSATGYKADIPRLSRRSAGGHFSDLPILAANVDYEGESGSGSDIAKPARLTQSGSARLIQY